MNTTFINIVKDCTMIQMQKEWIKIVHAMSPMAFLKSCVVNKHNILYNAILIQCSQKRFIHPAHFASTDRKARQKPVANQALNASTATSQVTSLQAFLLLCGSQEHVNIPSRIAPLKIKSFWNVSSLTVITTLTKLFIYKKIWLAELCSSAMK